MPFFCLRLVRSSPVQVLIMRLPPPCCPLTQTQAKGHDDEDKFSSSKCEGNMKDRLHVRMVQHLIETCLLFQMDRHQCVQALATHAHVHPALTVAVWKGLLKENKDFFQAYFVNRSQKNNADHISGTRFYKRSKRLYRAYQKKVTNIPRKEEVYACFI